MKRFLLLSLLFCPLSALAQQTRQISGQVVDLVGGEPLAGATIFIDPSQTGFADYTPQGTVADLEGRFNFTLPAEVTRVIVNYVGYEALTADISGRSSFTFRLDRSATLLEDVVVTGYQSIEKRKVTSSISSVDMNEIAQTGVPSIDQMLSGYVAGLVAMPTTGAPGAGTKLNIRGTVTLNGVSDPLWVLDGIALEGNDIPQDWSTSEGIDRLYNMSIAGVNPADIDNITILKDAAATAIYGARAANGVIVVTTKSGKRNESLRINANAAVFVTARPNIEKLNLMNASQKVDLELMLASNGRLNTNRAGGGVSRILDAADERQLLIDQGYDALSRDSKDAIDALRRNGTDWAREIYRPAVNQQYSLSLSGGGEKIGYYVSGGYFNERGTTRGTGFDRLTLTMKMDWDIVRKLNFGASVFVGQTTNESYISDRYAFMNPNRYTRNVNPYLEAYDDAGEYIYDPDMADSFNGEDMIPYNYFEERANTNYEMKTGSVKAIFDLSYRPMAGLDLTTQFGLQNDSSKTRKDADANSYFTRQYAYRSRTGSVSYLPRGGVIQNTANTMSQYTWRAQAEYRRLFARKHEIDIMAGVELRGATNENLYTQGFGYDRKTLRTIAIPWPDNNDGRRLANSSDFIPSRSSFYENRYLSYYMTGSYTFDNRYVFFGSIRYDGTNLFGVDPKYRYTPLWSVSGAWNIDRESWFENAAWLNSLRLRASYGKQGNVDRETSPYVLGLWNTASPGGTVEDLIDVSSPPNQNLRWETTGMWNAALEMSVLDNRLGAVFELYGTRSKDLITVRQLPYETGFTSTSTNYGEISGKGWELTLNSVNVRTRDFRWETSLTIAHSAGKIVKEFRGDESWSPSREGYSPGAIFGFRTAGLDENGVPMFRKNGEKVSLEDFVGYRYDTNVIIPGIWEEQTPAMNNTQADVRANQSYLGTTEPKLTGGFNNRFSFRGFDLAVSCNFVIKQTVMRTPFYNALAMNPGMNYSTEMSKVWSQTNTGGIYPVITGIRRPDGSAWNDITPDDSDPQRIMYWIMDNYGGGVDMFNNLDIWAKEMSYFRVNSIRLGYTLPSGAVKKMGMQSLRLNFEVRNPFVIATGYDGYFDPETFGNIYSQPIPRIYSLGLNITF